MALELLTVSSTEMTQAQADEVIQLCSQVFDGDYSHYMSLPLGRVHVLGYFEAGWYRMRYGSTAAYASAVAHG
ncbi:MAG TPA: hypothetical protein DDZ84_12280 [Firmicutes bacterium]|nr:hypothetical protein [Bacillota bacterium]